MSLRRAFAGDDPDSSILPIPTVSLEELAAMVRERNGRTLQAYGGLSGVAGHLNTSLDNGIPDAPLQIQNRRQEFGVNSYPGQSRKGFFSFWLDACRDPGLFIFTGWALHSCASGIKRHGEKEGWCEGAAIIIALVLTILVTSFANYNQGLQFLKLNKDEEMQKILVDVTRGRKKMNVASLDLVVGDVAFLKTGDQVLADGLFVEGHSLSVDESSTTGESGPVHVNFGMPFLLSGCRVIEGSGKMLVTGVGINTEKGHRMAETTEDAREGIPLQVCFNGISTSIRQIEWCIAVLGLLIWSTSDVVGHKEDSNNFGKLKAGRCTTPITILVLVLPKGLPFVVTLSLAYAMRGLMAYRELEEVSVCTHAGLVSASMVSMLRCGRSICLNIQKYIQFQMTVNVSALCINFIAAIFVEDAPLMAVQLLWVNLIICPLGALALATEPPTDGEWQRPSVQRAEPLISNYMIRNVVVQVLYQVVILLILLFWGKDLLGLGGPDAAHINTTVIFNAFVLCQLFNLVNARGLVESNILKGLFGNTCFVGILCSALALQVMIVEHLGKFASTVKLSWQLWFICIGIGFCTWPVSLLGKLIPVPKKSLCNVWLGA